MLVFAVGAEGAAAEPRLVRDVNTTPRNEGSLGRPGLQNGLELDGVLYFPARDRAHGRELWRTDGTEPGTWRVDDLCPGPCSSDPRPLATLGDRLLFAANDGIHGTELWSTTERRGAARLIHEAGAGPGSGHGGNTAFAHLHDRLYFASGGVLWRTDGTRDGTEPVVALDGPHAFRELTPLGGYLYFRGARRDAEAEIWRTDGTSAGTERMTDLCPEQCPGPPGKLGVLGDRLVFSTGGRLWALEGRSTRLLAEIFTSSAPVAWKGRLYFLSEEGLLATDGTPGGTRRVADLDERVRSLTALPDALLLVADGALWGMTAPDGPTRELASGRFFAPGISSPLTRTGGRAFFRTVECAGRQPCDHRRIAGLWVTDGTPEGTRKVTPLCGAVVSCLDLEWSDDPRGAAALGELFLFALGESATGPEPWLSDGTAAGTRPLADLWTDPGSADPNTVLPFMRPVRRAPAALGDTLLFPVFHARIPGEPYSAEHRLWATDGTTAGTEPVGPIARGVGGLSKLGEALVFAQDEELWRFNATEEPLELVSETAGPTGVTFVHRDRLYFGRDLACEDELWVSDGTAAETKMLGGFAVNCLIVPTGAEPLPGPFAGLGRAVVFSGRDEFREKIGLWLATASDELEFLAEVSISGGGAYRDTPAMANAGDRIVFSGVWQTEGPYVGHEPWVSDGTADGTGPVADLRPGPEGSAPHDVVSFRGEAAFIAGPRGLGAGESLWLTDGTSAGTRQVSDLRLHGAPSWATHLTPVGDRLFFTATTRATGPELWVSDGTTGGTRIVADIRPGRRGSYPQSLTSVTTPSGGLVVFAADGGRDGLEVWVSDGTAAGTGRVADIAPGLDSSSPAHFTVAGERLYFWADDPVHGRELRTFPLVALEETVQAGGAAPPAPPGEWLAIPGLAGFRMKARLTPVGAATLPGRQTADCIAETLCIEGALASRPEAFVKVIGPRPNGHLWVQISRFTPSELEVWVEQVGTGTVRYYRLPPVGPGEPGISGRQDRRAFVP